MTQVRIEVYGGEYIAEWRIDGIIVSKASGEFLFRIGDDSYFTKTHIETMIGVFVSGYHRGVRVGPDNRIIELEERIAELESIVLNLGTRNEQLEAENKDILIELSNSRNSQMVKEFLLERKKRKG